MGGLIDEVFVRIRPEIAGFAAETTAGIRGALTEVNAQVQAAAKANVAAAGAEIDANKAVADSFVAIGVSADGTVTTFGKVKAAAEEQQATIAALAKANIDATAQEIAANRALATSYEKASAIEVAGSDRAIAAQKLYAEAAIKAGIATKVAAEESSVAFGGVKRHLLSLGNILGVGFGAAIGVDLVKKVVGSAADLQKQAEAVRAEFGAAGASIQRFGATAATSLGISKDAADTTAARIGLFTQRAGFSQSASAAMAVNLEKLAGSVAMIRNVDPSTILQNLPLALQGNTRSLKQLGITVDTTSEKQALFGAKAALMTGALTPAQKALAIYRIAVANLGQVQAQASAHSGDLANVERKLSAEFTNVKDALGEALLPTFKKYVTELADWLQRMEKSGRLQKDFNSIAKTAKGVIDGVVGAIKAGVSLWSAFSSAVGGSTNAVEILLGVMVASKFAAIGSSIIGLGGSILGIGKAAIGAARTFGIAAGIIEGDSVAAGAIIDSALITTGIGALVVAIGVATAYIVTHWDQVRRWTIALGAVMVQVWRGVKDILIGYYKTLGGGIVDFLIFPMKEFIDVAAGATSWIPYIGDGVGKARDAVDGLFNSMKHLASDGADQIVRGARTIGGVGKAWSDSMAQSASSPDAKAKAKKAGQDIGGSFNDGLGQAIGAGAADLTKPLKPVLDQLRNAIESAKSKIHETVSAAKDNLVKIGDELAKTIARIQAKIGGAAGSIAGSPQGKAFAKLKELIESGAPSFEIARAQAALSSQLQNVGKTTEPVVKTQLDNLTAQFNKGQIGYRTFEERLHKILREDGITLQQALKIGGSALSEAYKAQVAALGKQAKAIAAIPAKFRGIGGAGGPADIKIIRPLEVIRQEQAKIGAAAAHQRQQQIRYAHEMAKYQAALLKQQQQEHRARVAAARHAATAAHKHAAHAAGKSARDDLAEARWRGAHGMGPAVMSGPTGPAPTVGGVGPNGAQGATGHLERIRHGIVHETATASAQRKHQVIVLQRISGEVGRLGGEFAKVEEAHVARPLKVLHHDNVRIAAEAAHQRAAILRANQRTNAELRALRRVGSPPGFGKYPPGKGSEDARMGAKAGNRS